MVPLETDLCCLTTTDGRIVGEKDLIRIASLQARNKTYMTMPNLTEAGLMGMLYLGDQVGSLQGKALEIGKQSEDYDEVMQDMIDKFIKFGKTGPPCIMSRASSL